jgi:Zn-dependent peptidase ImmA (M78 family)
MKEVAVLPSWAERLRSAIKAFGCSLEELYPKLDLDPDENWLLSGYSGLVEPTFDEYAVLSVATGIPLPVLTGESELERNFAVALRSGKLCAADAELRPVIARAGSVLDNLRLLTSWFPRERVEKNSLMEDALRARSGVAYSALAGQRAALMLRDIFELGNEPIADLSTFVEALGIPVVLEDLPESVNGITVHEPKKDRSDAVVFVNTSDWWGKQRFTLAHELGHAIFADADMLMVNTDRIIYGTEPREQRANAFARHFLAPDVAVRKFWNETSTAYIGSRLASFMMQFGLSREASMNAICSAVGVNRTIFAEVERLKNRDLMDSAGLLSEWDGLCQMQGSAATSAWMLSMALDAYVQGLIRHDVVASVLGRAEEPWQVLAELDAQGWVPST